MTRLTQRKVDLTRVRGRLKAVVLVAVLSPLIVSAITRTFGWFILLGPTGLVNGALMALGLIETPVKLIYSETGIVIGLTHVLVPFMVLSIYASLQGRNPTLVPAAHTLGAGPARAFLAVTLPLSLTSPTSPIRWWRPSPLRWCSSPSVSCWCWSGWWGSTFP